MAPVTSRVKLSERLKSNTWWIQHIPGVLTLGFALAYGLLRPAYERYYHSFGLTPEDVGLSETNMVARAVAITCILIIPVVLLVGVPAYIIRQDLGDWLYRIERKADLKNKEGTWKDKALLPLVGLMFFFTLPAALVLLVRLVKPSEDDLWFQVLVSVTLAVWMGTLIGAGSNHGPRKPRRYVALRALRLLCVGMASWIAAFAFWVHAGSVGSKDLTNPGRVSGDIVRGILSVSSDPAKIYLVKQGDDPLGICKPNAQAYAIGRGPSATYITYGTKDGKDNNRKMLPLPLTSYVVATGLSTPEGCNPKP